MNDEMILNLNNELTFDTKLNQVNSTIKCNDTYTVNFKCGANTLSYPKWILKDMNAYTYYEVEVLKNGSPIDITKDQYFDYLFKLYPNFLTVTNNKMQLIQPTIVTLLIYIYEGKDYKIPKVVNPWVL